MIDYGMTDEEMERALAAVNSWLAKRQGVFGWHKSEADLWLDVFRAVNPLCPVFPIAFLETHLRRIGYAVEHHPNRGYRLDLSNVELLEM